MPDKLLTFHYGPGDDDLITKTELCDIKGWSSSFFDSMPLPRYRVGKRDYFKLGDIPEAIESLKRTPAWASSKLKARPITISPSRSGGKGIEEARAQIKERMQRPSTGI